MVPSGLEKQEETVFVVVARSLSRQHALKALLGVLLKKNHINLAQDYPSARQLLARKHFLNALVVIDDSSLQDGLEEGVRLLKSVSPHIRCILLIEQARAASAPSSFEADAVLIGDFSGNQFLEAIQKFIE